MNVLRIHSIFSNQISVMKAAIRLLIRVAAIHKVMTKINESIVSEAESRSQNLLAEELVESVEIYYPNREMGMRVVSSQYFTISSTGARLSSAWFDR